ncbi:DUF6132 family protein [Dysgonomonas sp. 520]|uniref:DUF6132 family protein n=1 Tax=Dysgonomonas sp. 520 TaxID=2302931 RepID=UPI0013D3FE4D|nr:DUF6132 family protein [Dysgonomonas sp. 520]NDW09476.1 hypothetical protein [Dysgonomonas sp. 520]
MKRIRNILKQNWLYLAGAAMGATSGYLYWYFVGCTSGSCPITSSPKMSMLWGAIMGALLLSILKKQPSNENK